MNFDKNIEESLVLSKRVADGQKYFPFFLLSLDIHAVGRMYGLKMGSLSLFQ